MVDGQGVGRAVRAGGQRGRAGGQRGQQLPGRPGAGDDLAVAGGGDDRGGAAGPEGGRGQCRAVQGEWRGQGPVAAVVGGPGGEQGGGRSGAGGEQRCEALPGLGQPGDGNVLPGQGGGYGGAGCVPGPAGAGEDARGSRVIAGAAEQGCPGRGERGRGEVLQPAAAAGRLSRRGTVAWSGSSSWCSRARPGRRCRRRVRASRVPVPGAAASASGTSARAASSGPADDQAWPSSRVRVSGV